MNIICCLLVVTLTQSGKR